LNSSDFSFEMFFNEKIKPHLDELNSSRKQAAKFKKIAITIFFSLFAVTFFSFLFANGGSFLFFDLLIFLFPIAFISILVFSLVFAHKGKVHNSNFKEHITKNVVQFIDPGLSYSSSSDGKSILYNSQMFGHADFVICDDAITGKIDGRNFAMYDLYAYNKRTDTDGDSHKSTVFKGILLSLELKNKEMVFIEVHQKSFMHGVGKWATEAFTDQEYIQLPDEQFMDIFAVKTNDPSSVNPIINSNLRRFLIKLHVEKMNPRCSIVNGVMYLALQTGKNHFDFSLNREIAKKEVIELIDEIGHFKDIVIKMDQDFHQFQ